MTGAPVIGISTYRQPAAWSTWHDIDCDLLPSAYARSVASAGGAPVLVPPVESADAARAIVARLDGLLIAGGADVNPARYGQEPDPHVTIWHDDRDASELWLLDAANERSLSVLGICRGMQIMAVHGGGSLIQHLPDAVGHTRHSGGPAHYSDTTVHVEPGHRISGLLGASFTVPSHHHQAVDAHPGFVATARDDDGVMQAMEVPGERFALAVQWHPETTPDKRLFAALVEAAAG
jgi:putative glutamine amidotransferase